ncbi:MAG TPA: ABC transporter permease [Candidatus Limnocylindria bacterium]|nr:ABC transporter permease [Candidatus Limnocylindria bacterium]
MRPSRTATRGVPGRLAWYAGLGIASGLALALAVLPLLGLLLRVPPAALLARLGTPVVLEALRLSLVTSLVATALVVAIGLPVAYLLATRRFPGKRVLEVLVDLPMVLPPTVAGLALLLAFGRMGIAGRAIGAFGLTLPFTTLGVVVAQAFMAAPFFILPVRAGLASVDRRYVDAAGTLRASEAFTFFRVLLPLALPSVIAGAAMACARALGEFGATLTFAGNLPGVTQTMPLAVYVALQTDLEGAVALSVLLLAMSVALLLALRLGPTGLFWTRPDARRSAR